MEKRIKEIPELPEMELPLEKGKKIYFVSDSHFGTPTTAGSRRREKIFVKWLSEIKKDCSALVLCGDVFDFWFEWKKVVPRGYVRLLGKIAEFRDEGIDVHFFTGNHDMWILDYFEKELEIRVHRGPCEFTAGKTNFFVAHGDGLGPGDHGFKLMRWLFRNKAARWLFRTLIHPDLAVALAVYLSRSSRAANEDKSKIYLGDDREWLNIFSRRTLEVKHFDYFIMGHRHIPIEIKLNDKSTYINLGDWIGEYTHAEFDGRETKLIRQNPDEI